MGAVREDADELVVVVDFPSPELGDAAPCGDCDGAGVSSDVYEHGYARPKAAGAVALVVEVACTACGGCGRAEHDGCPVGEYAHDDPEAADAYVAETFGDPNSEQAPCFSCGGRRFNYDQALGMGDVAAERAQAELDERVQAAGVSPLDVAGASLFGELDELLGAGAQALARAADTTVYLRMPCGCTEDVTRTVPRRELYV
ncbi:hypothetical protein ACIRLA_36295 [Streptomyces sp. NPDC102364]|uniref:hypothetical protein n=1 Tax=Streptomyces sp. NPDC102364 TaxID=3366161 RepID=UPI003811642D